MALRHGAKTARRLLQDGAQLRSIENASDRAFASFSSRPALCSGCLELWPLAQQPPHAGSQQYGLWHAMHTVGASMQAAQPAVAEEQPEQRQHQQPGTSSGSDEQSGVKEAKASAALAAKKP